MPRSTAACPDSSRLVRTSATSFRVCLLTGCSLLYLPRMGCSACGTEIAVSAKFCPECGQPQHAACAGCGSVLATGAKFCAECGTPTGTSPTVHPTAAVPLQAVASPVAERRVCSVLF